MVDVDSDSNIAARVRDETIMPRVAELSVVVEWAKDQGLVRQDIKPDLVFHSIAGIL